MARLRNPLLFITLAVCGLLLLGMWISPRWAAQTLAAKLRQQIDSADDEQAALLVAELGQFDAAGLPHLLDLLDDERRQVRQAAREAISQRLEVWSVERTSASERSVKRLASLLAGRDAPDNIHSRVFVKLTALKLLRWPPLADESDQLQFLADCTAVLERTFHAHVDEPEVARRTTPSAEPAIEELTEPPPAETSYEPVSQLPSEPEESEYTPPAADEDMEESQPPAPIELYRPRRLRATEINQPTNSLDDKALRAAPTRTLIRHLQGVREVSAAAEHELRRRGFDDQTIQLARALDDPDPKVRQQLAEALPGVSGIEPAPWLWELAEDHDEGVRRTARGILATSSNPQTRARVGRLR